VCPDFCTVLYFIPSQWSRNMLAAGTLGSNFTRGVDACPRYSVPCCPVKQGARRLSRPEGEHRNGGLTKFGNRFEKLAKDYAESQVS
jgi:hypothetical protein